VSLTRFGTTFEHVWPLAWCTPPTVRRLLQAIGTTDANLGGTEMAGALSAVFAIPGDIAPLPPGEQLRRTAARHPGGGIGDVLLITDGEVWDVDGIIATARHAAQRVFVIGVGASPAEGALRRLAQATGGACEFATPGEALEAAAQRMLARIRQQAWSGLRIDWGVAAAWQGELPLNAFAGDTLAVFAGVPGAPRADLPVRLVSRSADGVDIVLAATATRSVAADDALPRVAAAGRLAGLPDEAATRLAVDYQLMSRYTNCVLVHLRDEADKATGEAQLHRVEGMLAAGWGASASVLASADMSDLMGSPAMAAAPGGGAFAKRAAAPARLRKPAAAVPELQREAERGLAPSAQAAMAGAPASVAGPSMTSEDFQRRFGAKPLTELADLVADHLGKGGSLGSLDERARSLRIHADLRAALDAVIGLGIGSSIAWTLLILWLDDQLQRDVSSALSDATRLRAARLDPAIRAEAAKRFDQLRLRVLPGQAAVA
jgi:Ca-activated chloride channel family protein